MKPNLKLYVVLVVFALMAMPSLAQKTPSSMVAAYDSLATIILSVPQAEEDLVRAILDGHYHGAKAYMKQGMYNEAAAEMALFASEGDNAVAGIRKRLVEGGHHHNAAGEEQGIYEEGYVLVTQEAKKGMLAASRAMRQAKDDVAREAAWKEFAAFAEETLAE
jgi:hypothetical protein